MEPPDPAEIAREILASLDLEAPDIAVHPKGQEWPFSGIVGWRMWMWADPASDKQWGPVISSETESGVTVTLTAQVTGLTWDMGNGDTVSCGKGSAWSDARTNGGQNIGSPDCTYQYTSRGTYTVTATAAWNVEWSGAGQSGTIPLELSRERTYDVVEIQSVNVPPGN